MSGLLGRLDNVVPDRGHGLVCSELDGRQAFECLRTLVA